MKLSRSDRRFIREQSGRWQRKPEPPAKRAEEPIVFDIDKPEFQIGSSTVYDGIPPFDCDCHVCKGRSTEPDVIFGIDATGALGVIQ